MNLKDRAVLITGAARRVGAEIAHSVAKTGAHVIIHYRKSAEQAKVLREKLTAEGHSCEVMCADLASWNDRERLLQTVMQRYGGLYGLVCNASIFEHTPFFSVTEKQWDRILNVNLKSTFFLCQQFGRVMLEQQSGKIVLITDVSATNPWPGYLPYTVSKAGVAHLVAGLAKALAPHVQVNGVAPGTVLPKEGSSEEEIRFYRNSTLLGRIGKPQDVAEVVAFLLEKADFITGTIIPVDGGYRLRGDG